MLENSQKEYLLEALVDSMGQPSYVYYHDFTNHITFDIIYELEDKCIVINGYEIIENAENEPERICVQYIQVCGKNADEYTDKLFTGENRFNLADK